jgi:hypothetical protein
MDRRDLLARLGVGLGSVSLGGCLAQSDDAVGGAGETTDGTTADDATETTTDEKTADDTTRETTETRETTDATTAEGGATARPELVETQFQLTDAGCGEPEGDASVRLRADASSVAVTGTIPGSNKCYVAQLADASYDSETGAFVVTVASVQKEGADMCAQCITQIDYEATFTFDGDLPGTVKIVHAAMGESATVATAGASGTATEADGTNASATTTRTD